MSAGSPRASTPGARTAADPPAATAASAGGDPKRGTRLREAQRAQISWGRIDLEAMLPDAHPARAIWAVVDRLDLATLYAEVVARDAVRPARRRPS